VPVPGDRTPERPAAGGTPVPGAAAVSASTRRDIPGPRGLDLLRLLPRFASQPLQTLEALTAQYGPVVELAYPLDRLVVLTRPEYIEHVLHQGHQRYDKRTARWKNLRRIWGDGLLTADGDVWRRQRQRIQPAFHQDHLEGFARVVVTEAEKIADEWRASVRAGEPRDVYVDMMRCTVRTLAKAMFGTDVEGRTDLLIRAVSDINAYINPMSLSNLLELPNAVRRWITPGFGAYDRALHELRDVLRSIVRARQSGDAERRDLLALIMAGTDEETLQTMSEAELGGELLTLLMAGHETVGIATGWSWYLLSQHPAAEQKLHDELDAVLGGRTPTFADVPRLEYARMVFQESMRLYPPIWAYDRRAVEDDSIGGYHIPKHTAIVLSPWLMHRHPEYWEAPYAFEPERFSSTAPAERPQYAYFPFGGGPRRCVGMRFALMQGPLMLASLAQSFRPRLKPGHPVEPWPRLNLPPKFGLQMLIEKRQRVDAAAPASA
jgi:cytochrome P450